MKRREFLKTAGAMAALATTGTLSAKGEEAMTDLSRKTELTEIAQVPLPYAKGDLAPLFTEEQMTFHYEKHHAAYLANLAKLIAGKPEEKLTLPALIIQARAAGGGLFNNAAQLWNHNFFWYSMCPKGGGKPEGALLEAIVRDFGSFDDFVAQFCAASTAQFGSGWGWLVKDEKTGKLSITTTSNAECPLGTGQIPLLTADVWEHAYYLDYQNRRADFLKAFFAKANWKFAEARFES